MDTVADIKSKKLEWMVRKDHGIVIKKYLRGNGGKKKNAKTQTKMADVERDPQEMKNKRW